MDRSVHNLPLLNMPEDMNNDRDAVLSFAQELRRACSESGFFYLKPPKSIFGEEENREIFEAAESFLRYRWKEDEDGLREVAAVSRVRLARLGKIRREN